MKERENRYQALKERSPQLDLSIALDLKKVADWTDIVIAQKRASDLKSLDDYAIRRQLQACIRQILKPLIFDDSLPSNLPEFDRLMIATDKLVAISAQYDGKSITFLVASKPDQLPEVELQGSSIITAKPFNYDSSWKLPDFFFRLIEIYGADEGEALYLVRCLANGGQVLIIGQMAKEDRNLLIPPKYLREDRPDPVISTH